MDSVQNRVSKRLPIYLMYMVDKQKQQSGFALLVSLIVVAAVLSIGLAILDLSVKQVRLAATTKDSEIAFHAANAGMECARFWRRDQSAEMTSGSDTAAIECFSATAEDVNASINSDVSGAGVVSPVTAGTTGGGDAYVYEYEFTWNSNQSCTTITTVVAVSDLSSGVNVTNIQTLIPGYSDGNAFSCPASSQCTVVSVQGYNRPCDQKPSFGTIQREVLLEF
jgi:type II secretory pathway pseudopilin PulG